MKFQGNIQLLSGGEILGARVENLAADPITPYAGQLWFNTTDGVYRGYTGETIMQFATGGALGDYLQKTGGTMTGALVLYGAPQADLEAATKLYVDGGLDTKQATVTGAATTIVTDDLTADRALLSDATGKVAVSAVTNTELGYVSGVTSAVQTQIDGKVSKAGDTMTGDLVMGVNKVTSSYVPAASTDLTNKAYVDSAIASLNWQADVKAVQTDATLDPGATPAAGDRYILTNTTTLHANFGTIDGVGDNDIVEFDGSAWVIAYDISAQDVLAEGTITWDQTNNMFVRFFTTWEEFAGLTALNAGVGLEKTGNVINVNLGAGVSELPTDEVGIDVYTNGGLFTTEDGTTSSTATAAQLSIKLDSTTLALSASGIKVADAGITATQIAAAVAGDGLTGGAGDAFAVGAGTGITVTADAVAFDETYGDARYINTAGDTMTGALVLNDDPANALEAATKQYVDALATRVDAGYYLYTSGAAATTHTVTHNMNNKYPNVTVVDSTDQVVIPQSVTFDTVNQLTVLFNSAIDCKVIVGGVKPAA